LDSRRQKGEDRASWDGWNIGDMRVMAEIDLEDRRENGLSSLILQGLSELSSSVFSLASSLIDADLEFEFR
jgi:hypothetical protein